MKTKTFAALCCVAALFAACEKNDVEPTAGDANGHEYVDLGLSVKWATCNVGASTPEGYGDYFAWGETNTKSTYSLDTYTYTDNKPVLDPENDAAHVNWGGAWRMPTNEEWEELRSNCTWTWTTLNGINGYEVKGSNGNAIFLPAAGFRSSNDVFYTGHYGCYWSSSLDADAPNNAKFVEFQSENNDIFRNYYSRVCGQSVRAVMK